MVYPADPDQLDYLGKFICKFYQKLIFRSPGLPGKSGAIGQIGLTGDQGAPGSCDHCPPARLVSKINLFFLKQI